MERSFTVFVPQRVDPAPLVDSVCELAGANLQERSQSTVHVGIVKGRSHALVEFNQDAADYITDAATWDWIDADTRSMLTNTYIVSVDYNDESLAREIISVLACQLGVAMRDSVFDNDLGVLLKMSDVVEQLTNDPIWRWDKESFPEISGNPHAE